MALTVKKTVASFEDVLATDDLFVDYFNAFLALPCFPEPVVFNRDNDVFELATTAPRVLAARIKATVRARRKPKPMYQVTQLHSFRNIPLTNVQPPAPPQPAPHIETGFTVQTLNREQGIEWVRAERLPTFLTSEHYAEFQLAKLISQAKVAVAPSRVIGTVVDPSQQAANRDANALEEALLTRLEAEDGVAEEEEKKEEEEEGVTKRSLTQVDEDARTVRTADDGTQTGVEAGDELFDVNDAKTKSLLDSMYVSFGETPVTETAAWMSQASRTTEPTFCCPSTDGRPLPAPLPSYGLPKSSSNVPDMQKYLPGVDTSTSVTELHDVCGNTPVPVMPLPPRVYRSLCRVEVDTVLPPDKRIRQYESIDPDCAATPEPIPVTPPLPNDDRERAQVKMDALHEDIDAMGAVIVATAMKYAMAAVSGQTVEEIESSDEFLDLLPDTRYASLTRESLHRMELLPMPEPFVPKSVDQKDDEDDTFKSDDDEDDRDPAVFRSQPKRTYPLTQRRGIEQLKRYLEGTAGERNWRLWVDIEKLKYSADRTQLQQNIRQLRETYHMNGAPYKLSYELQRKYGLTEPSSWSVRKLVSLQPAIAKPLILYWAPRYLLSLSSNVCPDKYSEYRLQKATLRTEPKDSYPTPPQPGMGLVPLRPKSCLGGRAAPAEPPADVPERPRTSMTHPPTGMHRDYSLPELFLTPSQKKQKQRELEQREATIATADRQEKCVTPKCLLLTADDLTQPDVSATKSVHEQKASADELSRRRSPRRVTADLTPGTPPSSLDGLVSPPPAPPPPPPKITLHTPAPTQPIGATEQQMEALLQALASEKMAGGYFRNFLYVSKNKLWKDSLNFWEDLQKYHEMFYSKTLDPAVVELKAKVINAKYIVVGAPNNIMVKPRVRDDIQKKLVPPFEELFDDAEEYILSLLFDAWKKLIINDTHAFKKVQLSEVDREIDRRSHYVTALQKKGLIKQPCVAGVTELDSTGEPTYDESAWKNVPEEYSDWTLARLVQNRVERDHLTSFLASRYASADLACWSALEALKRIDHTKNRERDAAARHIKTTYLNKKYFFGPSSPAGRKGQEKVISLAGGWGKLLNSVLPTEAMIEVQKYVEERLQKKWLPLFLSSEAFLLRQRPKSSIDNIVEDLMLQRKKRSQAIWKLLESKWVTSANDILAFRKALTNPVTSMLFRRFVSVKGDSLETDILFWQEIQKYKELCHLHSDISLIQQKTAAIINCFIDSPVPPSIQVDITSDMADRIIENKLDANPYLFREAQLTVFRVLFSHWQDFCMYRTGVTEEKVMTTTERNRIRGQILEEQRRAERPVSADIIEEEDEMSEAAGSRRGSEQSRDADARSWSYSQYVNAFDREDVIAATNADTFSAAALNVAEGGEENGDVYVGVVREGSGNMVNRKKSLPESRRSLKSEDIDGEHPYLEPKKRAVSPMTDHVSASPVRGPIRTRTAPLCPHPPGTHDRQQRRNTTQGYQNSDLVKPQARIVRHVKLNLDVCAK